MRKWIEDLEIRTFQGFIAFNDEDLEGRSSFLFRNLFRDLEGGSWSNSFNSTPLSIRIRPQITIKKRCLMASEKDQPCVKEFSKDSDPEQRCR